MIIALDLDYTLVAPKSGKRWNVIMADLFEHFDVPRAATLAAYGLAENKMQINVPAIAGTLNQQGFSVDIDQAQERLYGQMADLIEAYPEVPETLAALRKARLSIAIITAGDEHQQKKKAESLGIPYDHFFAVATPEEKAQALQTLIEQHSLPILFADDLPHALDAVYDRGLQDTVTTLRLLRGPHLDMSTRFPHAESANLSALLDILKARGIIEQ